MAVDQSAIIRVLNRTCFESLNAAANLAKSRSNGTVEVEHWLYDLVERPNIDCARIFRQFEVDPVVVLRDLTKTLDGFRRGSQRNPELSTSLIKLVQSAWVTASLHFHEPEVRSGVLLLALLDHEDLGRTTRGVSRELAKIKVDQLQPSLMRIVAGSVEDQPSSPSSVGQSATAGGAQAPGTAAVSKTPALDQYTINLTEKAKAGGIDPVVGREPEVRQMVDILIRRRQNNPILTGEAGVGKTAVVEGLARRIAEGDVPQALQGVSLRTLDLGLLQAGASVKGEFENRLKNVIAEVKASPTPIILFIDEAHTLIGAGGSAGQGDAANLLKPALARGELRTIAATTWAEYKKYFEKDAALARRFQVVKVEEPSDDVAVRMMRGLTDILEAHHGVRILEEAVEAAVKLSRRYIPARQLPDKSVSLLDTACARVAIGQVAIPPAVEDARREIEHLELEIRILDRELATGAATEEDLTALRNDLDAARERLAALEARWEDERTRVAELRELSAKIEALHQEERAAASGAPSAELAAMQAELGEKVAALRSLQGDAPLMQVNVDAQTVGEVVAGWTGIPVGRMLANEIQSVLTLHDTLERRVLGQTHALEAISERIRTARANLTDPRRPIGVFLLVGSSGVGKTETALALAEALYGGERNLITINMSEYQESHTVSGLKGSPPGYVGYGEGGVLTEAVRRRPYSVVLLDEVEKAHPDVLELFFQVFDKGTLEDGEGRLIDFKNTIILLTSNVGTDTILQLCKDAGALPSPEELTEAVWPDLLAATTERGVQVFKQAFLGRLIVVPFYPISDEIMRKIVRLQLGRIAERVRENHGAEFSYDDAVIESIGARCKEVQTGGRNVDHILTRSLLPPISREVLARMARAEKVSRVHVSIGEDGDFAFSVE